MVDDASDSVPMWVQSVNVFFWASSTTATNQGNVKSIVSIEIFDVNQKSWKNIFRANSPKRRLVEVAQTEFFVYDELYFANAVRLSFESMLRNDVISSVELRGSLFKPAAPQQRPILCEPPFRASGDVPLYEQFGDSYCTFATCVELCSDQRSFGHLDRVELAIVKRESDNGESNNGQSSSVVDAFWNDKSLVDEPSVGTFVYNVSSFGFRSNETEWPTDVIRLVGHIDDRSKVVVKKTVDDRRLPGQFEINEALLNDWQDTGDVAFPRNNQTPFGDNEKTSAVSVLNGQVIFVWSEMQDALWTFANDRWQNQGNGGMTKLLLNASEPQPQRRLATINDNIILVISAYQNVWHDGSVAGLEIARPVDQRVVDIYEIGASGNRWSNEKLTHHVNDINQLRVEQVDKNLIVSVLLRYLCFSPMSNKIDSGLQNIIDNETNIATVVSFRPIDGSLVECESNKDCESCLSNELNVERCRFCGNGSCQDFDLACQGGGKVFIDISACLSDKQTILETESTATNVQSNVLTTAESFTTLASTKVQSTSISKSTFESTQESTIVRVEVTDNIDSTNKSEIAEMEGEDESGGSSVALIVGLVIVGVLAIAIAWFAVWYFAIRRADKVDENGVVMADFTANSNRARYEEPDINSRYDQVEVGGESDKRHYSKTGI